MSFKHFYYIKLIIFVFMRVYMHVCVKIRDSLRKLVLFFLWVCFRDWTQGAIFVASVLTG